MRSREGVSTGARVGRRSVISRTNMVAAGRVIAAQRGLESVTLSSVAAEIGVSSRALYHYVAGIDELRLLVIDDIVGDLPSFGAGPSVEATLDSFARAARMLLIAHPGVAEYLVQHQMFSPVIFRVVDECIAWYIACGVNADDAPRCAAMFLSWLLTWAIRERALSLGEIPLPERPGGHALQGVSYSALFEFELDRMVLATSFVGR